MKLSTGPSVSSVERAPSSCRYARSTARSCDQAERRVDRQAHDWQHAGRRGVLVDACRTASGAGERRRGIAASTAQHQRRANEDRKAGSVREDRAPPLSAHSDLGSRRRRSAHRRFLPAVRARSETAPPAACQWAQESIPRMIERAQGAHTAWKSGEGNGNASALLGKTNAWCLVPEPSPRTARRAAS